MGVLIAGSSIVDFSAAVPMMSILAAGTLVLFVVLRSNESLERGEAGGLLLLYAAFLVLVVLETVGLVTFMT
jgi:cation:H+ antiporter